jgi:hypothetical protein
MKEAQLRAAIEESKIATSPLPNKCKRTREI